MKKFYGTSSETHKLHSDQKFHWVEFERTNFSLLSRNFIATHAVQQLRSEWQMEEVATWILSRAT
jgi:hypothetical protein